MTTKEALEALAKFKKGRLYETAELTRFEALGGENSFSMEITKHELNTCGICVDDGSDNWPCLTFQKAPEAKLWECTTSL